MKKTLMSLIGSLCILIALAVYQYVVFHDGKLHVVVCDVGQGDGIYIRSPDGSDILVDSGPDSAILSCLSRHMPFWDRTIDIAIITNADLDHYGGFIEVLKSYTIKEFVTTDIGKNDKMFDNLIQEVVLRRISTRVMWSDDILRDKKIQLVSLWPTQESLSLVNSQPVRGRAVLGSRTVSPLNPYSLVLRLTYGEFDVLLTGDIQPPATDAMAGLVSRHSGERSDSRIHSASSEQVDSGQARMTGNAIEILKVPHHGSKNGLTKGLLESVTPELAIISSGRKNKFGHPALQTLQLLKDFSVPVLRTDQSGDVEVVSDGKGFRVVP